MVIEFFVSKKFPIYYLLEGTKEIFGSILCEYVRRIDYEI